MAGTSDAIIVLDQFGLLGDAVDFKRSLLEISASAALMLTNRTQGKVAKKGKLFCRIRSGTSH
jgi:hypothetical protein